MFLNVVWADWQKFYTSICLIQYCLKLKINGTAMKLTATKVRVAINSINGYEKWYLYLVTFVTVIQFSILTHCIVSVKRTYQDDAEVYHKISAVVNMARKIDTYNERN